MFKEQVGHYSLKVPSFMQNSIFKTGMPVCRVVLSMGSSGWP